MPHVLAASYYSVNNNLNATLMVSNQGPRPLMVQPTLFSLDGQRLDVAPVILDGNTVRAFDVREWVRIGGASFREGSLQVSYTGKDVEFGGVVQLVNASRSLSFDEELSEPAMGFHSSQLESVWWLPSNRCEVQLVVSNTTDAPLSVTVKVDGERGRDRETEDLNLLPHETRVLDVRDFVGRRERALSEVGGISITHNGTPGAVLARGLIAEAEVGYSSVMEFSDPQNAKSTQLDGAGLRVGKVAGEKLNPIAVARNAGDAPTTLTGHITYTTNSGSTSNVTLPEVRLAGSEAKALDLAEAIRRNGLSDAKAVGLEFAYTGTPGSVVMAAQSVSQSRDQVFRLPIVDAQAQMSSTGFYPWSAEGNNRTVVYIKNTTDQAKKYTMQVGFAGGVYVVGLKTIEAGQTVAYDIRALRDQQTPDEQGLTIPLTATGGQVIWSLEGPSGLALIGRAEQVDVARGLSSTSSCQGCCQAGYFDSFCDPASVIGTSGETTQFTAFQRNVTCFGQITAPFAVSAVTWTSNDTTVATVDAGGLATAQDAGSTQIHATWEVWVGIDVDEGGGCIRQQEVADASATCDVRPRIDSLTPARGLIGSMISVTINGRGFRTPSTISFAGGGITADGIVVSSSTQLTAEFTISPNATPGNHAVTVTSRGQTSSNSKNFFVQVPGRLVPLDTPQAPNGIGPLRTPVNEDVVTLSGQVVVRNVCGVYRSYLFFLADQEGQRIFTNFTLDELFSNVVSPPQLAPPAYMPTNFGPNDAIEDLQFLGFSGGCLQNNEFQTFTQKFKITVNGTEYSPQRR